MLKKSNSGIEASKQIHRNLTKIASLIDQNLEILDSVPDNPSSSRKISLIIKDHNVLLQIIAQVKKIRYEMVELPPAPLKKQAKK